MAANDAPPPPTSTWRMVSAVRTLTGIRFSLPFPPFVSSCRGVSPSHTQPDQILSHKQRSPSGLWVQGRRGCRGEPSDAPGDS